MGVKLLSPGAAVEVVVASAAPDRAETDISTLARRPALISREGFFNPRADSCLGVDVQRRLMEPSAGREERAESRLGEPARRPCVAERAEGRNPLEGLELREADDGDPEEEVVEREEEPMGRDGTLGFCFGLGVGFGECTRRELGTRAWSFGSAALPAPGELQSPMGDGETLEEMELGVASRRLVLEVSGEEWLRASKRVPRFRKELRFCLIHFLSFFRMSTSSA